MIFDSGARLAGTVAVNGTPLPARGVRAAIRAGLGYVPADRKRLAAMLMWTVRENLTLPALRPRGVARWLGGRSECDDSRDWLTRLQVTPDDPERMFSGLSGGNQQKVILARWLRAGAQVYLLDEPTNGVDLLGKHALYEALATAAASGAAVVLASSDLEELCALCDRVLVVRDGVVGRTLLAGGQLTVEMLGAECTRDLAAVTHGDQSDAVAARA
jgi:ribose transport system ATP-binding protein